MRLAVHALCRFLVGRFDQAEDPATRFVEPIGQEPYPIPVLDLEVSQMRRRDIGGRRFPHIVAVHEDGHAVPPLNCRGTLHSEWATIGAPYPLLQCPVPCGEGVLSALKACMS